MSDEQGATDQQAQVERPAARKWGDPLDGLNQERKDELSRQFWDWTPETATDERPGPFAGQRLDGLEVFWLACCAISGRDGTLAEFAQQLTGVDSLFIRPQDFHLEEANLSGAQLQKANLTLSHLETLYVNTP